ncbi:hypothetical protein [Clostridium sp.]|uniref:hypothetical protein n=1 Tax=Clostridium sp. TaxID=1506 RepID=UPI002FC8C1D8
MDGKEKRVKGYTVIECIAYIAISSIVLLLIMNVTIDGYKYSLYRAEQLKREDEIDNAILNIRKIFNERDNTNYIIENNYIKILKEKEGFENVNNDSAGESVFINGKEIKIGNKNIRVYYYYYDSAGNKQLKTSNLILEDVSKCSFFKKENLIYMDLKVDEKEYLICM